MRYENVELHNVWETKTIDNERGLSLSRLPLAILPEINAGAAEGAALGAGCEIRGLLPPGGSAAITLQCLTESIIPPLAEVYFGAIHDTSTVITKTPTTLTITEPGNIALMSELHDTTAQPFHPRLVRIKLPHLHACRLLNVEGDLTYPEPDTTPAQTMLAYGSSITNGAHAVRPTGTYASQTARHLGCDLINLGFGGSAHMDAAIAKHIAERTDWDFATLEMGINVRSWPLEQFHEAVDNFVSTIVASQPDKFVFCMDLFTNNQDFIDKPTQAVGFRESVREIAEKKNSDKVVYVDGRTVLTDPTGLRPDLVHPDDEGMLEMGANLAAIIRQARG